MKPFIWLSLALWGVVANVEPSWAHMPTRDIHHTSHNPGQQGKHVGAYFPSYSKKYYPLSTVDMSLYSHV